MKSPDQGFPGLTPIRVTAPPMLDTSLGRTAPINAAGAGADAEKVEPAPIPPIGARYTLYCQDFTGPSHVALASRAKSELMSAGGMKGWYVVHQADRSTLFYGYYKQGNDPEIRRDRAAIEGMQSSAGNRIFKSVMIVPVDAPDPAAPPEWNLANLRRGPEDTQRYWTIQIAAYRDSVERKQAAVESVRAARAQGIEAYYYHGETISSVCVGVWPMSAVRVEGLQKLPLRPAMTNDMAFGAGGQNPDDTAFVLSGVNMPENVRRQAQRQGINVADRPMEIVDPTMAAIQRQYAEHAVNGVVEVVRDASGRAVPKPSFIVEIPVSNTSLTTGLTRYASPPPEALRQLQSDQPAPAPGAGRLKSVGK